MIKSREAFAKKAVYQKEYARKNREKLREYNKNYYLRNRQKAIEVSKQNYYDNKNRVLERNKIYRKNNKLLTRATARLYNKKRKTEVNYKLATNLRSRLGSAIKNNVKKASAVKDLGCSIAELKMYLESKFQEGMTWNNWSRDGWHIDHIIALSTVDLTDEEEIKKVCHYTNLRPMWAKLNISKGNKCE